MCSVPVTFGGGSWMLYAGLSLEGSAANQPADSQRAYHLPSTARGSKLLSSGISGVGGRPAGADQRVQHRLAHRAPHDIVDLGRDLAQHLALDLVGERARTGFEHVGRVLAVHHLREDRNFLLQPARFFFALLRQLVDEAAQGTALGRFAHAEAPAARSWLRIA